MNIEKPNYKKAEEKAKQVIDENSIIKPPIIPSDIANNYGLTLIYADFAKQHSDVAGFLDIDKKTIYINNADAPNRQVFTIAHELGHWLLHKEIIKENPSKYSVFLRRPLAFKENDFMEKEANCFAANLLVPKKFLLDYKDIADISTLAQIFIVSQEVIGFRLKDLQTKSL